MTVGELIVGLKELDPSLVVLMPRDDEGNGYNRAYMPSRGYCPDMDSSWIEDVIPEQYFDDYEEYGLEEKPKPNCITL